MHATRTKPEKHWHSIGAAIASQDGSMADLDRVKTGKSVVDGWIMEGYAKASAKRTRMAIKAALADARGVISLHQNAIPGASVMVEELDTAIALAKLLNR